MLFVFILFCLSLSSFYFSLISFYWQLVSLFVYSIASCFTLCLSLFIFFLFSYLFLFLFIFSNFLFSLLILFIFLFKQKQVGELLKHLLFCHLDNFFIEFGAYGNKTGQQKNGKRIGFLYPDRGLKNLFKYHREAAQAQITCGTDFHLSKGKGSDLWSSVQSSFFVFRFVQFRGQDLLQNVWSIFLQVLLQTSILNTTLLEYVNSFGQYSKMTAQIILFFLDGRANNFKEATKSFHTKSKRISSKTNKVLLFQL
ncbi:hypothetical protein ABPG74_012547 [Tetrahymena malaccensis]